MSSVKKTQVTKDQLTNRIDLLKREVQYLIDKKKDILVNVTSQNKDKQLTQIDQDKMEKIKEIKRSTQNLKLIAVQEREQKQRAKELTMVSRAIDSIEFGGAKKRNRPDAIEKAKSAKELRDQARETYNAYVEYCEKYMAVDPSDVPAMLFLHDSVLEKYKLCPYIKLDIESTEPSQKVTSDASERRKAWLQQQQDEGKLYFDLYERIVLKIQLNQLQTAITDKQHQIEEMATDNMSDTQKEIFNSSTEFMREYTGTYIKTKRLKERYKSFIHNLSVLYSETGMSLHEYFDIKYKTNLMINEIRNGSSTGNRILGEMFSNLVTELKELMETIETEQRYINNTLRNVKHELYLLHTNQKYTDQKYSNTNTQNIVQIGKFFKRWSTLTRVEQNDRFMSFAMYYVEKFAVQGKLLADINCSKDDMVEQLYKLLSESYEAKTLIYRDFTWNTNKGMIENMKVIRYNEQTCQFHLSDKAGNPIARRKMNEEQKRGCIKTVITKETEKVINEEILSYVIRIVKNEDYQTPEKKLTDDPSNKTKKSKSKKKHTPSTNKDLCIERIKEKLKIKKLSLNDKAILGSKYDNIYQVVKTNEMNE
uniref:Uncharacterized protein n=1 Tax=viral metagenome TaxID=1070528 RepID=A0A6C0H7F9_9ZZZZ